MIVKCVKHWLAHASTQRSFSTLPLPHALSFNSIDKLLLCFVFLLLPGFFVGGSLLSSYDALRILWNLGHLVFFAALTLFCLRNRQRFGNLSAAVLCASLLVFSVVSGMVIEAIQASMGRAFDVSDIGRNVLGVMMAVALFISLQPQQRYAFRALAFLLLLVIAVSNTLGPVKKITALWQAKQAFPQLTDFESTHLLWRWQGNADYQRSTNYSSQGHRALQLNLGLEKYSGVSLRYFPGDWRGYAHFNLDVFNAGRSVLPITLRIHDAEHEQRRQDYGDRYNQGFALLPGWNAISVDLSALESSPAGRLMNMQGIKNIGLFVTQQVVPQRIYIDNLRLQ